MCVTSTKPREPLWQPSARRIAEANLTRFMAGFRTYDELWRWSVEQRQEFWQSVRRFCGVKPASSGTGQPRMNYAAHVLRHVDHAPAIIAISANGVRREMSHRELYQQVSRAVQALRASGLAPGDRFAALLPSGPEAVVAFLAGSAVGAVWAPAPIEASTGEVADHFRRISPKLMITGGAGLHQAERVAQQTPSLGQVLVVTSEGGNPDLSHLPRALRWQDALALYSSRQIEFTPLPLDHPLSVCFAPDAPAYGSEATLLQHLKELVLHTDLISTDRLLYRASGSSPLWIWQLSALSAGSCAVLLDLPSAASDPLALWRAAELERATILAVDAGDLAALRAAGERPGLHYGLRALRTIATSGEVHSEDVEFVYREVKRDLHFAAMRAAPGSPGHEALGCPILPVNSPQPQVRGLGMPEGQRLSFF